MTALPKTATSAVASPDAIFGNDTVAPSSAPQGKPGNSKGRNRNSHLAPYVSQVEAHRILGINPKTLREWKAKGCDAFNEDGKVNIGKLIEWREAVKYDEGANQERVHQASTGTLTVAQMQAEMEWLKLMKMTREEDTQQGEWVRLEVIEANLGRMMGRIKALLRVMPEVIDPELELAMLEGANSSVRRKAIMRDATEEVCRIVTMDRIINGDPEDQDIDDLEQRLAEAAEDE